VLKLTDVVTHYGPLLDHGTKIAEGSFEEVRQSPAVLEAYLGRQAGRA